MKRYVVASIEGYSDYNVTVTFGGFIGPAEELTVFAKSGATEEDILNAIRDDYKDDLLDAEIVDYDGEYGYTVEVTFGGYIGMSEEYDVIADSEEDALDQAINEATWSLEIDSFEEVDE